MWLRRDSKGERVWSASLQEPGTRHTETFGDIDAMFVYLQNRLDTEMLGTAPQDGATNE
jgi:hypothetical protein